MDSTMAPTNTLTFSTLIFLYSDKILKPSMFAFRSEFQTFGQFQALRKVCDLNFNKNWYAVEFIIIDSYSYNSTCNLTSETFTYIIITKLSLPKKYFWQTVKNNCIQKLKCISKHLSILIFETFSGNFKGSQLSHWLYFVQFWPECSIIFA